MSDRATSLRNDDRRRPRCCRFCGAGIPRVTVGRPAEFCSSGCRQADYRERAGMVKMSVYARRGRRYSRRVLAEEKRLRAAGVLPRWSARVNAASIANDAWPLCRGAAVIAEVERRIEALQGG